ncbi:MAG: hypothetical protein A3H35_08820 [Betaproteobacteria bacterium RIFCSPLOWO2_02_FULL_62_17]|nr:MAG: hypothetical protein A3H35_08820 [Betaproteobacteria bacterium RIFCSPLOWO2_02_FULL_62_17]
MRRPEPPLIPIEQYKDLFDRIVPVLGKSGVLASIFVTEFYQLMGPGIYGHADCYAAVGITRDQLNAFCRDTGVKYTYTGNFHSLDGNEHRILHFRKSADTRAS